VHRRDEATDELTAAVVRYALERIEFDPPPLDHSRPEAELRAEVGRTITADGIGALAALRVFTDVLAPACVSTDHPRFLSFVPVAPTVSAILFDLVVGASALYGGSWLEGGGAVFAENEALRWLADIAGLPPSAGGVFVSGGSAGNLSALVAARYAWRSGDDDHATTRGAILIAAGAHSSVRAAARVMDADIIEVPGDEVGRLTGENLAAIVPSSEDRVFAVVATAGSTNAGIVDDLAGVAEVARANRLWLHVDGAYGGAALAAPSARALFSGIEAADSLVIDPHKWLFAPFDCAALIYRDPSIARAAHTQHAAYLEVLTSGGEWNPSDYAFHLTRRARGLPFWFSLASHGTRRYAEAVETTLALTRAVAAMIRDAAHTELIMEPQLSTVLFRRVGWSAADYHQWSKWALDTGLALVVPTVWAGETLLRFCFVNPTTTVDDVALILDSLR
jgi:glutamate/tyrosine decarboxylase-like PLP-dependent enzyme